MRISRVFRCRRLAVSSLSLICLFAVCCGGGTSSDLLVPRGSTISVILHETLDTESRKAGDPFRASLSRPFQEGLVTYAPLDSEAVGVVDQSGITVETDSRARMSLRLTGLRLPNGEIISLETVPVVREGDFEYRVESIEITTGLDVDLDRLLGRGPAEHPDPEHSELRVEIPSGSPLVFTLAEDLLIPAP